MKSRIFPLIVILAVFVGVLAGLIIASNFSWSAKGVAANKQASVNTISLGSSEPVSQELQGLQSLSKAFVEVAKEVNPAVVTINSEAVVKRSAHPFMDDEFFRRFFNIPDQQREEILRGLGSGVIVNPDGYILTNNHVVQDADEITVNIDKKEYKAKVVGKDPGSDIAVIKIERKGLPTIKLGNSDDLEVGEWVMAVGNPFSNILQNTVTAGIVSAKGRSGLAIGGGTIQYQDFIQTDAAINPGNSGGALVNLRGELVGINTAIVGQANVGIGFAIPINLAKSIMEQLINKGRVIRGWLGVYIQPVDENMAKAFKLERPQGALVSRVQDDSPAAKAGMKAEDIILRVNNMEIEGPDQLTNYVASLEPGKSVNVIIWRDAGEKTIEIKLGERPSEEIASSENEEGSTTSKLGIEVENLTDQTASRFGYEDDKGVLISDVTPNSVADREGLHKGDLIVSINRKAVTTVREFSSIVNNLKTDDIALLRVKRGDGSFFRALRVPAEKN
jgi:serine protease Do